MTIQRFDLIREICRGKYCLDVGVAGYLEHHLREPAKWVLHHVTAGARRPVGMDIDGMLLARLQRAVPSELVCSDAQRFAFQTRVDVIIAGQRIEHLANPVDFLSCCRENPADDGTLVITTPNVFSVNSILKALLFGRAELFREHVGACTVPLLCGLLRRCGFQAARVECVTENNRGLKNSVFTLLSRVGPEWSETLVVVAQPFRQRQGGDGVLL